MTARRALFLFFIGVVSGAASLSRSSPACPRTQGFGLTITAVKKNGTAITTTAPPQGYGVSTSPDGEPSNIVVYVLDPDTNMQRTLSLVELQ
jgi:hypothetical protein